MENPAPRTLGCLVHSSGQNQHDRLDHCAGRILVGSDRDFACCARDNGHVFRHLLLYQNILAILPERETIFQQGDQQQWALGGHE